MYKRMRASIVLTLVSMLALSGCGGTSASPASADAPAPAAQESVNSQPASDAQSAGPDTDSDGIPDEAETALGTDPNNSDSDGDQQNDLDDSAPTVADNPMQETSTTMGFTIDSIVVENNVDAQGAGVPDHLELKLSNATQEDISNFDIYYTFTDSGTGEREAYFRTLPGFTLKAGESKSLHLDNTGAAEHFSWNSNSLFFRNPNLMKAEATVHAEGYAPVTASVDKDPVGAEGGGE
jgi:hypothetical protein